jgi:hypothetical protein
MELDGTQVTIWPIYGFPVLQHRKEEREKQNGLKEKV